MSPFLSSATGEPTELRRRIAFQANRGVPAAESAYRDFRSNGGPIIIEAGRIARQLISPSGEPQRDLPGKLTLGGSPFALGDLDPNNPLLIMALLNLFGLYDYTDNTTWQRWVASTRGASAVPDYLSLLNDDDILPRYRIRDLLVGGITLAASPGGNLLATIEWVASEHDFHGAVVQTEGGSTGLSITGITRSGSTATATTAVAHGLASGDTVRISGAVETEYNGDVVATSTGASTFTYPVTGTPTTPATGTIVYEKLNSTLPVFSNTWAGNWAADATDQDLYLELVSLASDTWTVRAKVGAAASYSSTFTVKVGLDSAGNPIYTRMADETGGGIGPFSEQIKVHLPAGGTYRAGDIFKVPKRRVSRWVQTLDIDRPIGSVNIEFRIADEAIRIEGGISLTISRPVEVVPDTPGRQGATTLRRGPLNCMITPARRITDLRFQKALHQGTQISAVLDMRTDVEIGVTTRAYRALVLAPSTVPSGPMYGTEAGGQNRDEAPTLMAGVPDSAFTYDGITTSAHVAFVLENDVTTTDIGL